MSSHHIVRDEQEPALILVEVGVGSFELAGHLLGWSPLVVALPGCLADVLGWGIKIDAVLLPDGDQISWELLLAPQQPLKIINAQQAQLNAAVDWVIGKKAKAINILGEYSPDYQPPEWLAEFSEISWTVYSPTYKGTLIRSGKYQKWHPEGTQVFVSQEVTWLSQQDSKNDTSYVGLTKPDWVVFEVARPTWVFERISLPENGF